MTDGCDQSSSAGHHAAWIAAARRQVEGLPGEGSSASVPRRTPAGRNSAPADLPDYEVLRELHRGGQGVVYEARQKSIPRRVAVKVMHAGRGDTASRMRFEREVSVLARLDHAGIVGILDRGEFDGHPYLVMDLVEGRPLDRYAREESLDRDACLRLFVEVCDAVSAAHLRGVIHRDLKPRNILVDEAGRPRVLDFGLAVMQVRLSSPDATATGQFVGSLPWASPEQALGQHDAVDVRSDVYSLGVILFHLLTGQFPYLVTGHLDEVLARIRSASPVRPGSIVSGIDPDLDTIVLTCLQKEPERRYQSVGELARDIRHYLAHEPIMARRDSTWYVLRKSLARHRAATATAIAFAALVAIGLVVAVTLWQQAEVQRTRAESESAKAAAVSRFLQDALASASPEVNPGEELSVRAMLEAAADELDAGSLAQEPETEAAVRCTIGQSYLALGRIDEALQQLQHARQLLDASLGPDSPEAAGVMLLLAAAHLERDEAAAAFAEALAAHEIYVSHEGDTRQEQINALRTMALAAASQGNMEQAVALRVEAIEIQEELLGPDHPDVGQARAVLAMTQHDTAGSTAHLRNLIEKLEQAGPSERARLAQTYRSLGCMLHLQRQYDDAEKAYRRSLELTREIYGPNHPRVITLLGELAFLARTRGDSATGEALLRETAEAARQAYGPDDSRYADFLVQLAALSIAAADYDTAEATIQYVLDMSPEGNPPSHWTRAQARSLRGDILVRLGRLDEAEPLLLEGYDGLVRSGVPGDLRWFATRRLVQLYERSGETDKLAIWKVRLAETGAPMGQQAAP